MQALSNRVTRIRQIFLGKEKQGRFFTWIITRLSVVYIPLSFPSEGLWTWSTGAGTPFSSVLRIKIHGKIWLQPCMSSRHTPGRFFNVTLTPAPGSPSEAPHWLNPFSKAPVWCWGKWWWTMAMCTLSLWTGHEDSLDPFSQLMESGSYPYQICDMNVIDLLEWGGCICSTGPHS